MFYMYPFLGSTLPLYTVMSFRCADYKKVVEVALTKWGTSVYHHALICKKHLDPIQFLQNEMSVSFNII